MQSLRHVCIFCTPYPEDIVSSSPHSDFSVKCFGLEASSEARQAIQRHFYHFTHILPSNLPNLTPVTIVQTLCTLDT